MAAPRPSGFPSSALSCPLPVPVWATRPGLIQKVPIRSPHSCSLFRLFLLWPHALPQCPAWPNRCPHLALCTAHTVPIGGGGTPSLPPQDPYPSPAGLLLRPPAGPGVPWPGAQVPSAQVARWPSTEAARASGGGLVGWAVQLQGCTQGRDGFPGAAAAVVAGAGRGEKGKARFDLGRGSGRGGKPGA